MQSTFPRIRHIPGSHADHDDLVADAAELHPFLNERVFVFEKLDGLNVTLRCDKKGRVRFALKRDWRGSANGTVERAISIWVRLFQERISQCLSLDEDLYGEWLWHRVSRAYRACPDVFVVHGCSNRNTGDFITFPELRDRFSGILSVNMPIFDGRLGSVEKFLTLTGPSDMGPFDKEGLIVERLSTARHSRWLKWVAPDYVHPVAGDMSGEKNGVTPVGLQARRTD